MPATKEKLHAPRKTRSRRPAATSQKSLQDLLHKGLTEICSAEKQLLDALPVIIKASYSEDLQDTLGKHLEETGRQVERLRKVFQRLKMTEHDDADCPAMEGLIREVKTVIREYAEGPVRDSALIIGVQKIEHYEIACYGSICELCDVLGYWNVCDILGRTLEEEEKADLELTEVAMYVNDEAFEMSETDPDENEDDK